MLINRVTEYYGVKWWWGSDYEQDSNTGSSSRAQKVTTLYLRNAVITADSWSGS